MSQHIYLMAKVNLNLSIGYQNIEGLHHPTLGCKLTHCLELFNDIEILSETWTECTNCKNIETIENYELIKTIEPLKIDNKGRKSGGIKNFSKSNLKPHIKVKKSTDHYAWIEIQKNIFHGITKNPLICAIYTQPKASKYYTDEIWDNIELDILNLTGGDTPFTIIGDMNGRVGTTSEFSETHKNETINTILTNRKIPETPRRNCDKAKPCAVGEKIIQMCKSFDMQIGNGRTKGYFFGNLTHYNKKQGHSTIDLA